jgi:hypothetical protein
VPKGSIYFATAFSLGVETLNLRAGHPEAPVRLRQPYVPELARGRRPEDQKTPSA